VTAADGLEALDKIRELLPDLVLLDVMMPKLDGIETVKRLKADNQSRHTVCAPLAGALYRYGANRFPYLRRQHRSRWLSPLRCQTLS